VKVDKSENLDNAFDVFTFFFDMTLQKNVKKSRFWILKKNVKNVFSNYDTNTLYRDVNVDGNLTQDCALKYGTACTTVS